MTHVYVQTAIVVLPLIGVLVYVGVHGALIPERREREIQARDGAFRGGPLAPHSSSRSSPIS